MGYHPIHVKASGVPLSQAHVTPGPESQNLSHTGRRGGNDGDEGEDVGKFHGSSGRLAGLRVEYTPFELAVVLWIQIAYYIDSPSM
ncbi:hypothetical protein CC1G_14312 [Coprinopsis cinerea okayama7|uniref:Uncharacterized protein n=1 Tax=Coprinopsis cinerea (strain Okayama-7 / 130 / ATCC MYA-4618 / FGSC 9003) TaxID=240176 RepID=D6RLW9_COPC7|nr:hypothetical protein CC1G_14312 [Coprinopsis cinerea okayama7\|eukprot:XP_002911317.1 hypothetical protein CC1G_14312 [Coprinopsis cinerea okayama7\